MTTRPKIACMSGILIAGLTLLNTAAVDAAPLTCAQEAYARRGSATVMAMVMAAFSQSPDQNSNTPLFFYGRNHALVQATCLLGSGSTFTCLRSTPAITFVLTEDWSFQPVPWAASSGNFVIDAIPLNTTTPVQIRRPSDGTIWQFLPHCENNLLVGNDNFGNHWVIGFDVWTGPR
jgi:hypothetical protein